MKKMLLFFLAFILLSGYSFASIAVITKDYNGSLLKIASVSLKEVSLVSGEYPAGKSTNETNNIEWGIYLWDKKSGTIWRVNSVGKTDMPIEQIGTEVLNPSQAQLVPVWQVTE